MKYSSEINNIGYKKNYESCEMDSLILGTKVARILSSNINIDQLLETLNFLKLKNFTLVYWKSNEFLDNEYLIFKQMSGVNFITKNIKYALKLNKGNPAIPKMPFRTKEYNEFSPNSDLRILAIECNKYSHLKIDPLFPIGFADRMYIQWLRNSMIGDRNGGIIIAQRNQSIIGMAVYSCMDEYSNIDLIAIRKDMRRKGVGSQLINAVEMKVKKSGATVLNVETQIANIPASRLYEKYGFRLVSIYDIYHFWL